VGIAKIASVEFGEIRRGQTRVERQRKRLWHRKPKEKREQRRAVAKFGRDRRPGDAEQN
jgi:hypothetical protein